MNKKNYNAAAVIEIGANNVRMRVAQLSKGQMSSIDYLEYPLRLGHDVFETGSLSFEGLRELSLIIDKFLVALRSYNIQKPTVISCSAFRDAKNRSLAVDQLRVRNGVDVTVLEDSREKAYIDFEIVNLLENTEKLKNGNTLIVHVGSGSIGIAVYDGEKIIYSQNIPSGSLKLWDVLSGVRRTSEDFHTVIEEYLDTILNRVTIDDIKLHNIVLTGSQIDLVATLCGVSSADGTQSFGSERLSELYSSLRTLAPESIALRYGISESDASLLYISLSIYHAMLRFCPKVKTVYAPAVDICTAVARCALSQKAEAARAAFLRKSAVACAVNVAEKFGCDMVHSEYIRETSCRIFDKLKKIHGLDASRRIILELASILHSCGSFVSVRQHNACTYDLIRGMDLFGLSAADVLKIALVAGSISNDLTVDENPDFDSFSQGEKLVVSKLAAMFRMANALDKAHKEKLHDIKISVEDDRVVFKASSNRDTLLEQWAFAESSDYFKEVFGLSPELSHKFELK